MASLRTEMPLVTAWITQMRQAFGPAEVDGWVRQGLADGTFHAQEAGHEVGRPSAMPENAISLADMVIAAPQPKAPRPKAAR